MRDVIPLTDDARRSGPDASSSRRTAHVTRPDARIRIIGSPDSPAVATEMHLHYIQADERVLPRINPLHIHQSGTRPAPRFEKPVSNYRYLAGKKDKLPNAENIYHVGWESLPLTCPMPEVSLWNSHPHVYIPLHETDEASCMYCGARYILIAITLDEKIPTFANSEIERKYHIRVDQIRRRKAECPQ